MKRVGTGLVAVGLFLNVVGTARAMEGTVKLGSKDGKMGSCFAVSVYYDGRYRVLMTCRGLQSALDPVKNRYVAWVKKGENLKKLGEIVNGKMQASLAAEFERIEVTAEADGYANKPEGEVLLAGEMKEIAFEGIEMFREEAAAVVTPTLMVEKTSATAGSAFKAFGKALLTGFAALLLVVGALSYLSRRGGRVKN